MLRKCKVESMTVLFVGAFAIYQDRLGLNTVIYNGLIHSTLYGLAGVTAALPLLQVNLLLVFRPQNVLGYYHPYGVIVL